jgi:uncharacterized membrane protein
VLYFVVTIRWIVPAFNEQGTYSKYYLYAGLGGTPGGIVAHFFQNPTLLLGRLFTWRPLGYAMTLTAPLALAPLRRPVVLAALPTFIFICLMDTPDFASIKFWHQATLLPILWLAMLQSVAPRGTRPTIRPGIIPAVLVCTGLTHYALGFSPISRVWRDVPLQHERESALIARLHALIPKSDTVQASARLAAHFIDQDRIYPLHRQGAPPPRWVLIDLNESFTGPEDRPKLEQLAQQLCSDGQHDLLQQLDSILVFRRKDAR